jgi:hypothetical protein
VDGAQRLVWQGGLGLHIKAGGHKSAGFHN